MEFIRRLSLAVFGLCMVTVGLCASIAAMPCAIFSGFWNLLGVKEDTPILCIVHLPYALTAGIANLAFRLTEKAWGIKTQTDIAYEELATATSELNQLTAQMKSRK